MISFYEHQSAALEATASFNRVAYYHDMGLGKTFTGAEKMMRLEAKVNLLICQKSKIDDWMEHFARYYFNDIIIYDLTIKKQLDEFISRDVRKIGVINYELAFRRDDLKKLSGFTLVLDESSKIQHESRKQSKFILSLNPKNVILLSGTPTGGKYELLWSQLWMLGWHISKKLYYRQYVDFHYDTKQGFPIMMIDGYKNVERLKKKMREYGCHFLKTEDVFDLPEQINQFIYVPTTKSYREFKKKSIITAPVELVGDTTLTKMLYERQLCGHYSKYKLDAFRDILESTTDRLIVFYNFNDELDQLQRIVLEYTGNISVVNGKVKDLQNYHLHEDSVTFIQYQAGAMGLNMQKSHRIIYFTPPLSSELFEQSKKRTHRIGQNETCFYYYLTCRGSVEEKIYNTLAMRRDYTERLFEMEV